MTLKKSNAMLHDTLLRIIGVKFNQDLEEQ
jgi:hypothetical protein